MADDFVPDITEDSLWPLEILVTRMKEDPEYLEDLPYSFELKNKLRDLFPWFGEEPEEEIIYDDPQEELEAEIHTLLKGLKDAGNNLETKDNSERMAYFRTATSLIDKLVGLQERAANLRQLHRFYATVANIFEEVLEPAQRTQAMERLKEAQDQ